MDLMLIAYFMYMDGNSFLKQKGIDLVTGDTNLNELKKTDSVKEFIKTIETKHRTKELEYDHIHYIDFCYEYSFK